MGQKINPNGFRLGIIKEHQSRWFADASRYPTLLQEDFKIRHFLTKNPLNLDNLKKPGISEIRIERKADQIDNFLKEQHDVPTGPEIRPEDRCEQS